MLQTLLRGGAALSLMLTTPFAFAQTGSEPSPPGTPAPLPVPMATSETRDADPALWVVKDEDTTIYLFGTVHVLKPGLSWFDEAVRDAFDRSDELVLEMVMPSPEAAQAAVIKAAVNPTGPSLTERLPETERPAYIKALTELGMQPAALDRLDPWFAASTITVLTLGKAGYDPASGVEQTLTEAAKTTGKPVTGLETMEQQFGFFDALSEKSQLAFLTETVRELPRANETIDRMVDQWAAGDPDALATTMNEGMKATPEIAKILLADRNVRWAAWIKDRLAKPGTVFVAVGAGHLAGSDSVQAKLVAQKLKAERIAY